MSQTIITAAFESYLAGQIAAGEVVTLDEFVFAYIDGLDPATPISPDEVVPAKEDIVCRQAVDKTGVVNEDAVVYSVTLGTGVGDFSFNWVGLINQASGMLGAVTHIPTQDKYATTEDDQGNILTRSFLMGYAGAKLATQISTPAETWQIDFSARLSGIDERQRMENVDLYGPGAFFDTGFLVTSGANGAYTVAPGAGYVGGLRVELSSETPVVVAATPVKIWVDAHWTGTVASIWNTQFEITAAPDLQDYTLNGYQHYVFAVAEISETGEVTDLRPQGTLDGGQQAGKYVLKTTKVNGHELSGDVNVTSQDIFSTQAIGIGNLSDLNTYVTPGLYFQPSIAQAQTGANYPEATAGSLEIYKHAGITQIYRVYVGTKHYIRSLYDGVWSPWAGVYDQNNKPTPAEIGAAPAAHGHTPGDVGIPQRTQGWHGEEWAAGTYADKLNTSGFYNNSGGMGGYGDPFPGQWTYLFHNSHANGNGYCGSIALSFNGASLAFSTIESGTGQSWAYVYSTKNPPPASSGDSYSDTMLGAARWADYAGGGQMLGGAGEVLIGLQEQQDDNEIHGYWFKPIQKMINGAWYTIAG